MNLATLLNLESMLDIVDVGASLGEKPIYQPLLLDGLATLTGFEPSAAEIEKLNLQKKHYETYLQYFIGAGGPATFHETSWALTGSLYEPNPDLMSKFNNLEELTRLKATHPVETHRLDDVSEIANIDMLKMDIQGAELPALQNATEKLKNVLVLQVEVEFVELYKGQPLFSDVDLFLRSQGFQFHTFLGMGMRAFKPLVFDRNPNKGLRQFLWSDAVYVRDWMDLSALSLDKLKKYALILDRCYGSVDLAHLILSETDKLHGTQFAQPYLAALMKKKQP